MKNAKFLYILLIISLLYSCTQPRYLSKRQKIPQEVIENYPINEEIYTLQPYDYLYIEIKTPDEEINKTYNQISSSFQRAGNLDNILFLTGYMIDKNGYLTIPTVGTFHAAGKTIDDLREEIKDSLDRILNSYILKVRIASFNIFFLGEVQQQGKIPFYKENISVLEAIAKAGGITNAGDKKRVMIIRRQDTVYQVFTVDLTKREILSSSNFFLRPNDIVYVPQRTYYIAKTNLREYVTLLTTLTSTITTILFLIQLTK